MGKELEAASASELAGKTQSKYKFMTNLYLKPKDRTIYVKQLESLTADPKIPFTRLVIAAAAATISTITFIWLVTSNVPRAVYIGIPAFLILAAILGLIVQYIIPSRDESSLVTVVKLAAERFFERKRRRSAATRLASIGIKDIDEDGLIHFDDGNVGVAYAVSGQLTLSTLPAIADQVSAARRDRLVVRSVTTQEVGITSTAVVTFNSQLAELNRIIDAYQFRKSRKTDWLADVATAQVRQLEYLKNDRHELTIKQYRIIREISEQLLDRAITQFEQDVMAGCYNSARRLTSRYAVITAIDSLTAASEQSRKMEYKRHRAKTMQRGEA